MTQENLLTYVLLVLGGGFLFVNAQILIQYLRYLKLRRSAVLVWPGQRPAYYGSFILIGAGLAIVIIVKLIYLRWPPQRVFGEAMMLLYYGYMAPLSLKIGRGFYEDGVWLEDGFMRYGKIGGLSWREEETSMILLLIPRMRRLARRLVVPLEFYGEARKVLREKIKTFDIHFTGKALDLGAHDERDDV
jgi:histone H3/H4